MISASAIARLMVTVVLPSDGFALVSTITRGWVPLCPENSRDVKVVRKASASKENFRFQVTNSTGSSSGRISVLFSPSAALGPRSRLAMSVLAVGMTPNSGMLR